MPKSLPEELAGKDLLPICLAAKLSDAKKIESVLDNANIEYTFEITPITGGFFSIIFGSIRKGVMFLVHSEQYDICRGILEDTGLSHLFIDE